MKSEQNESNSVWVVCEIEGPHIVGWFVDEADAKSFYEWECAMKRLSEWDYTWKEVVYKGPN